MVRLADILLVVCHWCLAITDDMEPAASDTAEYKGSSEVDPPVAGHGKPDVVCVSIDSTVSSCIKTDVFRVINVSFLCEDLHGVMACRK